MAANPAGGNTRGQRAANATANPTATGIVQGGIGEANRLGFFNPMGSQAVRAALARRARRSAEANRRRAGVAGRLAGLDPQAQQQNIIDTERGNAFQTSDYLNSAAENQLVGGQDWSRQLLGGRLGQEDALAQLRLQAKLQGGGFGSQLGGLLGTGVGAFLGGPGGAAIGGRIGGGLGGGGGDYSGGHRRQF